MEALKIILEHSSLIFVVLVLGALSGLISACAGVVNIGIEGMMTIGALAFSSFGKNIGANWGNWSQIIALLVAGLAGMWFACFHAFAAVVSVGFICICMNDVKWVWMFCPDLYSLWWKWDVWESDLLCTLLWWMFEKESVVTEPVERIHWVRERALSENERTKERDRDSHNKCVTSLNLVSNNKYIKLSNRLNKGSTIILPTAVTLKSDQIISGVAINILAAAIAIFVVQLPGNNGFTSLTNIYQLPKIGNNEFFNLYLFSAIIIWIGVAIILEYTKWGLHQIATGENPNAVDAAGINVIKQRYVAVLLSGFLAGIAGGVFPMYASQTFRGRVSCNGFIASAI